MTRGRKPLPLSKRRVRGQVTAEAAAKAGDLPDFGLTPPPPPPHFDAPRRAVARAVWILTAQELWSAGLLPRLSLDVLSSYCVAIQLYREALEKVELHGQVIPTKKGNVQLSPYLSAMNRHEATFRAIAAEFGMTPSAQTRVGMRSLLPPPPGGTSGPRHDPSNRVARFFKE